MTKQEMIEEIKKFNKTIFEIKTRTTGGIYELEEMKSYDLEITRDEFVKLAKNYLTERGFIAYGDKFIDDLTTEDLIKICNIIE